MSRNSETHFSQIPHLNIQRSLFDLSHARLTTFNAGKLIPILKMEVLPGDTFALDTKMIIRQTSALKSAPMDTMYADLYYFYVPNRIVHKNWASFLGENKNGYWKPTTTFTIPQILSPTGGWNINTLADYFDIRTGITGQSVSAIPGRAYTMIWNEYFRDENLMAPAHVYDDDATKNGSNYNTPNDAELYGEPLPVCKLHGYFSSALPEPLKGDDVMLPLGLRAPVYGNGKALMITNGTTNVPLVSTWIPNGEDETGLRYSVQGLGTNPNVQQIDSLSTDRNDLKAGYVGVIPKVPNGYDSGIYADLTTATAATINQLYQAFAINRFLINDARGGTRYREILNVHFGVQIPDERVQIPEYLGGKRLALNTQQVVQTSSGVAGSPQGNITGYSYTGDESESFTKSFLEHGYIIGLICVRTDRTYQQGIDKDMLRKNKFDFYWNELANIGEMPILNKQIFSQGSSVINAQGEIIDDLPFGYQEPYAEYRTAENKVSGQMRSDANTGLDMYHYADDYSQLPILSSSWIAEDKTNIDRTLAVTSATVNQFLANFWFRIRAARELPAYSVPGLQGVRN